MTTNKNTKNNKTKTTKNTNRQSDLAIKIYNLARKEWGTTK